LHAVAVLQARPTVNTLAVDERAIATLQIRNQKLSRIYRIADDSSMIAAHQVITVGVIPNLSVRLSPDQQLVKTLKRNFLHLIGLRPT
jgi:hypothetical protein